MSDNFAALDGFNLLHHGDDRERDLWPIVATELSNYELFWRALIVLLSNRIEPSNPVGRLEWIQARASIPCAYERLAMHNYSLFYFAAKARQAIDEDRQRLASENYPHPETAFFLLQASVEHAQELQRIARDEILCHLGIRRRFPKHPEPLYKTIRIYRNAFTHNPVLGRRVSHDREFLPPETHLPKREHDRYPPWRDTASIPTTEMIDLLDLEEDLWRRLSAFLQNQWEHLTEAFVQARQCPKFIADLRLGHLLPIRCTTLNTLWSNSRSETTSGSWVFPMRSDATSL
jgi:hypothetical protein